MHKPPVTHQNGRMLGDLNGRFTCHTPNGSSTVDYVIVSDNIIDQVLYFKVSDFVPTLSDTHCKLEWEISAKYKLLNQINTEDLIELTPNFVWSDESVHLYQSAFSTSEIQNKLCYFNDSQISESQESIDDAATELSDIIISAASNSLKRLNLSKKKKNKDKKWFDKDLHFCRSNLLKYGKTYSRSPNDPAIRNHYYRYKLYREYNKLRKAKYRQFKQSLLEQLDKFHGNNPKEYWRLIDELKQSKTKPNESSAVDPSVWFSHFQSLNKLNDKHTTRENELRENLTLLEKANCFNELDMHITCAEISKAISKLKSNKSPGLDNISNNMLKFGQSYLLPSLQKMFNTCLSNGIYPSAWAKGYITPIHKSGSTSDPNNYRGITVTSAVGKLFNCILNNRLDTFLESNSLITDCQIGFTKKARTTDHMFILKCIIDKYCQQKHGKLYACFVDFQKAFDTVIHTGIKIKLLKAGVGTMFYKTIKSMYNNSQSCIRINNHRTDFIPVQLGVKQGDHLSPNLFKIFINDLPLYLANSSDPVRLVDREIPCLMYADDLILLSNSSKGLQCKLDILLNYCQDWCLNVNHVKTKVIIFNKAGRLISERFAYGDQIIQCVSNYKYLGIQFNASGTFALAQDELYNKALKAYFKLKRELIPYNPSVRTSLHLFDHTISPILLYGCEIWGSFNIHRPRFRNGNLPFSSIYKDLKCEKLHLKFCKNILGVHKKATNFAVLSELGRFPLYFNIIITLLNYWHRLESPDCHFPLLKEAYITSKNLHASNKPSWYGTISSILENLPELQKSDIQYFKHEIKKSTYNYFIEQWKEDHIKNIDGKLRTYVNLKTNFGRENYLSLMNNSEQRRNLTRLRISCHHLRIESGRYLNIPLSDRTCLHCSSGDIEDESHFLLSCSKFVEQRQIMSEQIAKYCSNYKTLSSNNKLIWLLNNEDLHILNAIGTFLRSTNFN